jgi:fibrillarin-like rRNA methylase
VVPANIRANNGKNRTSHNQVTHKQATYCEQVVHINDNQHKHWDKESNSDAVQNFLVMPYNE